MSDQENSDSNTKEQELAEQLSTYADGFTAFSFVQGATFCFLVAQNAAIACELRSQWKVAEVCLAMRGPVISYSYTCASEAKTSSLFRQFAGGR